MVFAHGQMNERQLEKIMFDFVNGDIDVLVSTTIIETGLDIPNANTMIIHDADRMGLSQLYQLRGRVGRSNRVSYAFLMYKRDKMLKEEAEKRLQAIREFTELGSGIKIAMRDLEIRGAGNVLGAEQHGHMEAVGYDLYCKLLNQAVQALKGKRVEEEDFQTVVDCDINAYIPAGYIKNEYQKLDIYKRISAIENEDEYMDMQDELIDRFGELPKAVENLLKVAYVKALAHRVYMTEVNINRQEIRMTLYPKARLDMEGLPRLIADYQGTLKVRTGEIPGFFYQERSAKNRDSIKMMEKAEEIPGKNGGIGADRRREQDSGGMTDLPAQGGPIDHGDEPGYKNASLTAMERLAFIRLNETGLFVLCVIIVKQLVNCFVGVAADRWQGTAPSILGLAESLLNSCLELLHLLRIIACQSGSEIKDPLGSVLNAPETVLGDSLLSLCLCLGVYGVVAAGHHLPEIVPVCHGNVDPLLLEVLNHHVGEAAHLVV